MSARRFARQAPFALCAYLLAGSSPLASAQEGAPTLRVNAAEITLGGRVQTQFNTSSVDSVPWSEMVLRRARLESRVKVSELVSGRLQVDFAGERVATQDAFLHLHFSPAFQVIAGRQHRPFGILTQTSSVLAPVVERGARIRGLTALDEHNLVQGRGYSDRDVGMRLEGEPEWAPLGFTYALGYFSGPLRGKAGEHPESPRQYVGRMSLLPLPALRVGLSASSRYFRDADTAQAAVNRPMRRGTAWALDAEYGAYVPGLHLMGELAWGDYDPFRGISFFGAQSWLAYRTAQLGPVLAHLEPMLRASYGDFRGTVATGLESRAGALLTPGLNLYFDRLNRFMLNYDVWLPASGAPFERSFKAMFQLAF